MININTCWKMSSFSFIKEDQIYFRVIKLCPTIYKIYFDKLASRLTTLAIINDCLSTRQKGIHTDISGIQYNPIAFESDIQLAKRSKTNLFITLIYILHIFCL